ncbi:MAG TPA: putative quinol monooxygenase [Candidatus Acidoferrales bacterium]|jgi:autoinducer 2-degrading protein|nr:putative quinol monooxygenase [Candidatus Acidoferrales bacterium]
MSTIVQSIRFTYAPENAEKVEPMFRELQEASRKEPGVVAFDVARGRNDANVYVLWEVYRDDAALEAHKASEHFKRLVLDGVRPLALERAADLAVPI